MENLEKWAVDLTKTKCRYEILLRDIAWLVAGDRQSFAEKEIYNLLLVNAPEILKEEDLMPESEVA